MIFRRKTKILRQRGIYSDDFPGKAEFVKKVRQCQARARGLFPEFKLRDEELPVVFVKSGRIAGMAKRQKNIFNIEFSVEAIKKDREEMIVNTIPHEMAHIVDMVLHKGRSSHGESWKEIVTSLGGSTERTHRIPLERVRRSRKFLYRASCGTLVEVGPRHHRMVQRGGRLVMKKTDGWVTREGFTGKEKLV